jgi:SAM-dependent methyltransferase
MADSGEGKTGGLSGWWAGKAEARAKFHAWWEGYEYEAPAEALPPAPPPKAERPRARPTGKVIVKDSWPPERVKVAQMVWGDGFSFPGGADYAVELARPLDLRPDARALDIGCGLGGGTRAVARAYGAVVEGWDLSPDLIVEGHGLSIREGIADKAPIDFLDIEKTVFAEKRYGAALIRNVLSSMSDKEAVLRKLAHGLAPGASFVLVEFCLGHADAHGEALDAYRLGEATAPRLLTIQDLRMRIEAAGFAIERAEDHSAAFAKIVLTGWAKIDMLVERGQLDDKEGKALMGEAELWRRRLEAMRGGDLRAARVIAARKA